MIETHHIGQRVEKTTADKSTALGEIEEVLYRSWARGEPKSSAKLGDQFENMVAARIDSQRGVVIHRLTPNAAWTIWHVDLTTDYGSEQKAAGEAKRRMMAKPPDGAKEAPLWSAFRWPCVVLS
jgi:hypothetical protein